MHHIPCFIFFVHVNSCFDYFDCLPCSLQAPLSVVVVVVVVARSFDEVRKNGKKKSENRKMKTLRYTRQTIFFFNIFAASNWLDFLVFRLIEYLIAIPRIRTLMARTNREKAHVVASRKKQYVVVSVSGFTLRGNCREEKNLVQD